MKHIVIIYSLLTTFAVMSQFSLADDRVPVKDCRTSFVHRATLSAERAGVLARVPGEGDRVLQGDIVVRLRDDVPRAILKVAQARAESSVAIQAKEKSRLAAAFEYDAANEANQISSSTSPAFPATHMTRLKLNAEAAELEVDLAKHERHLAELQAEQAQAELETYWSVAKHDGTVTRVFKREGEGVQQGESIVQVVNTNTMRVEGYVNVGHAPTIAVGMPVNVSFQVPQADGTMVQLPLEGKLGFVDVSVQTLSGVVRVWAEIENQDGALREGLNATMEILTQPEKDDAQN